MIVSRTWMRTKKHENPMAFGHKYTVYEYVGWFLFGIFPLYIKREFMRSF
jgi:hypothetical protein